MSQILFYGSVRVAPGTPSTFGTINSAIHGTINAQLFVDAGNMTTGDELEIYIGNIVSAAGTMSLQYPAAYADYQATQIKVSEPFVVLRRALLDLKMTAGGARWFNYEIISIS